MKITYTQNGDYLIPNIKIRKAKKSLGHYGRHRIELIVPELAKQYGVTEKLKAENQMEWVRQMNACKAQAEEIVKHELIYTP